MVDGRVKAWRRGERYADCAVLQVNRWGGQSVMVWGGISYNHRTDLVIVEGSLTARHYINEIIEPHLFPFMRAHNDVVTFQQDNARPHTACITRDSQNQNNIQVLPWPSFSPDLNPIEHLWDQLGRAVRSRQPRPQTRQELVQALLEEWDRIPQERIRRLIRSMRPRLQACIDARGGHIPY